MRKNATVVGAREEGVVAGATGVAVETEEEREMEMEREREREKEKVHLSLQRPHPIVVTAVAMIGSHVETGGKERHMANRLLTVWDDGTAEYQYWVRQGMSLSAL